MTKARDPQVARLIEGVLMPGFVGTSAPDWLLRSAEGGLGGVCLFAQNVSDDLRTLTDALRTAGPELLIASDEEGGPVTRLDAATGSRWPAPAVLGRLDDVGLTRSVGAGIGAQCAAVGVDLALAPSVDVNSNPDNPIIGLRSFGPTSDLVARHGAAFVTGIQSAGVLACAKHFPGHGDTAVDSHVGLPVVPMAREEYLNREAPPFRAAIAAGVATVMTAHVAIPAIDDGRLPGGLPVPATLSPAAIGLLRNEFGFDGLVLTDALDMQAIAGTVGRGAGAVLALLAGSDLICIGNPAYPRDYDAEQVLAEVRSAIAAAVDDGTLPINRLAEAAQRAGNLPKRQPRAPQAPNYQGPNGIEDSGDVHIAPASLLIDLRGGSHSAAARRRSPIAERLDQAGLRSVAPQDAAAELATHDGDVIVLVGEPHRSSDQQAALEELLRRRPELVTVVTGLPHARARLGRRWVRTWGDSALTAEALHTSLGLT